MFIRNQNYDVPFVKWLDSLPNKVQVKCRTKIERFRQCGAELRQPEANYLRDGIYEQLAVKVGSTAMEIERLEDSDYEEIPLSLFRKIAIALNARLEMRLIQ